MMAATIIGCSTLTARSQPAEWLPLLPEWSSIFTLKGGGGYKDNVTFSHAAPEPSAFVSAAADALVTRQFLDGSQLNFFASGEERHYFSAPTVDADRTAFFLAQGKREFLDGSEGSLALQYLFQDEVVDVSVTETNRSAVRVRGHSLLVRPGYRADASPVTRVTLELPVTLQWLNEPLDNYWEAGPRMTLTRNFGKRSEAGLTYELTVRAYDTFAKLDADGLALSGTRRIFLLNHLRLNWRNYWDEQRHWRSDVRAGCRINSDNGSGYFDYVQVYGSGGVRCRQGGWTIETEARASHFLYSVQRASTANSDRRERTELNLNLRCERQLYRKLSLVGACEYERVFSNDELETYSATTVSGGLQWEF
jgi:hypothetical protein